MYALHKLNFKLIFGGSRTKVFNFHRVDIVSVDEAVRNSSKTIDQFAKLYSLYIFILIEYYAL